MTDDEKCPGCGLEVCCWSSVGRLGIRRQYGCGTITYNERVSSTSPYCEERQQRQWNHGARAVAMLIVAALVVVVVVAMVWLR